MIAALLSSFIIVVSLILLLTCRGKGTSLALIFSIWWSMLVLLNRMRLSDLQLSWTMAEEIGISLLVFLPVIFFIFLQSLIPRRRNIFFTDPVDVGDRPTELERALVLKRGLMTLIGFSIIIFVLDLYLYGIPLFSYGLGEALLNQSRLEARTPVLYGIAHQFFLIGVIGLALVKARFRFLSMPLKSIIIFYLIHSILMFGRGSVVYLFAALVLSYVISEGRSRVIRSSVKLLVPVLVILISFDIAGQLRQGDGEIDGVGFDILEYGGFNTPVPAPFAWFYGYVVISLDNLVMCLRDFNLSSEIRLTSLANFSPSIAALVLYGDNSLSLITDVQEMPYVGRFNLITGFGFFAHDFGWLGAYLWSTILALFCLGISQGRAARVNVGDLWFVYLGMAVLFITVGNLIFTSRIVGILIALGFLKVFIYLRKQRSPRFKKLEPDPF